MTEDTIFNLHFTTSSLVACASLSAQPILHEEEKYSGKFVLATRTLLMPAVSYLHILLCLNVCVPCCTALAESVYVTILDKTHPRRPIQTPYKNCIRGDKKN